MKRAFVTGAVIASGLVLWLLLKPEGSRLRIQSRILDEKRILLIRLPRDYEASGRSYPVLYILDAVDRLSTYGPSFYRLADRLEEMGREGLPPMILVGVANTHRARDMIPVKTELEPGSGQAETFLQSFAGEIIPHIEAKFRTTGERLLSGRSDSGLFALYALLEKPELFSGVIASSPTVGFCPDLIKAKTERLFRSPSPAKAALFIISGDNDIPLVKDFLPAFAEILRRLRPESFRFEFRLIPNGGHIPKSGLEQGLRFIFSGKDPAASDH